MIKSLNFICVLALIASCSTNSHNIDSLYVVKEFSPAIGEKRETNTGGNLLEEGAYIPGQQINISETVNKLIPGSMFIPFPIMIKPGVLFFKTADSDGRYFCAHNGNATATFPILGSVIDNGDCVGIRVSLDGNTSHWFVDNSIHNNSNTTWTSSMSEEEKKKYPIQDAENPYLVKTRTLIVFDGHYGGQLHFTLSENNYGDVKTKSFTFDFIAGKTSIVGIKGHLFEVLSVDNVKITYRWIKI